MARLYVVLKGSIWVGRIRFEKRANSIRKKGEFNSPLRYLLIFKGKYIVNVLPLPSSLCTSMRP